MVKKRGSLIEREITQLNRELPGAGRFMERERLSGETGGRAAK